ncbi:protein DMP7 [Salvia miltiorrhiza]|uniref:protein DMP7 n=1 Tax=Salvia miltiorrhiza TaxID=226208 RepID=UPI0025AC58E8|nr:protein DMP7 [Salvia miltiorrhiza]
MENSQAPFLENQPPAKPPKTPRQKVVRKAFKGTAHLSKLLPTGSVLTFQFLSPIVTHDGKCRSIVSQGATAAVLAFCAATCFAMSFTDSFRDERGKVRYGVATFRGLWVVDGSGGLTPEEAADYRVRLVDFVHAFLSIAIFAAVAMFDKNVVGCFWPSPSEEALEILTALPVTVGVVCGLFFVMFPTRRHGVGFPLSRR